jgi:hypothetical protein
MARQINRPVANERLGFHRKLELARVKLNP